MIDTTEGARTWTGHGVFAHNLTKIATLTARNRSRRSPGRRCGGRPDQTQSADSDESEFFRSNNLMSAGL